MSGRIEAVEEGAAGGSGRVAPCLGCNARLTADERFCHYCGRNLFEQTAPAVSVLDFVGRVAGFLIGIGVALFFFLMGACLTEGSTIPAAGFCFFGLGAAVTGLAISVLVGKR